MGKPDAPSHHTDHGSGWDNNSNMMMLSPELFWVHVLSGLDIVGEEHDILQDVWCSLCDDDLEESVAKAARELRRPVAAALCAAQSGQSWMASSCSTGRSMSPETKTSTVTLWNNTMTHVSLVMLDAGRHWSWLCATTGGPRCPATSASMSRPVTSACRPSSSTASPMVSYIQQRLQRSDGIRSLLTLWSSFPTLTAMMQS